MLAIKPCCAVSKMGLSTAKSRVKIYSSKHKKPLLHNPVRYSSFIPKDQYSHPWSTKMKFPGVLKRNWEVIPLFATTGFAIGLVFFAIYWSIRNKVDVVYTTHNRKNISRTMDLAHPTYHKLIIINQEYKPYLLMKEVLEKMADKEEKVNREECKKMGKYKRKDCSPKKTDKKCPKKDKKPEKKCPEVCK